MPIVFLLSFSVFAVDSFSQQVFINLNKPFLLERRLKSKVVNVGIANKLIDINNPTEVNKLDATVDKPFRSLQKEFGKELEKKFTPEELLYLNKVFSHALLTRLVDFQNEFIDSHKYDKMIKDGFKVFLPSAAAK